MTDSNYIVMTQDGPMPMSPEDIAQFEAQRAEWEAGKDARQADEVRADRNQRLASCDWTQLSDAPVDATAWATYRQELRDVTGQGGFPWTITWPEQPTT